MRKLVKVCGLTEGDNIRAVESLGVDLTGFIFYPRSPRCVRGVPTYLPARAGRVGVFVDASFEEILSRRDEFGLEYVQLHGSESPALCRRLRDAGLRVIKAFGVGPDGSGLPDASSEYGDACDLFLFDTRTEARGGSGKSFDWSVLERYAGPVPFLLSGGIGPDSVEELKKIDNKYFIGVDLNSRFESEPGVKDVDLLSVFLQSFDPDRLSGRPADE